MAQIKTLTYSRTINLGNYESERLEATVELEFDNFIDRTPEDPAVAFDKLKQWVLTQIYTKGYTDPIPLDHSPTDKLP